MSGTSSAPTNALCRWKNACCSAQLVEIVGVLLDVAVGRDEEACRARCRVLHDLAGLRLHQADDAVDQWARREILARARFLVRGVLLQQPLIEIAEPFLAGGEPVELVDVWS